MCLANAFLARVLGLRHSRPILYLLTSSKRLEPSVA